MNSKAPLGFLENILNNVLKLKNWEKESCIVKMNSILPYLDKTSVSVLDLLEGLSPAT